MIDSVVKKICNVRESVWIYKISEKKISLFFLLYDINIVKKKWTVDCENKGKWKSKLDAIESKSRTNTISENYKNLNCANTISENYKNLNFSSKIKIQKDRNKTYIKIKFKKIKIKLYNCNINLV